MHVIRLRGPWDYEPLEQYRLDGDGRRQVDSAALPECGRLQLPANWRTACGGDFCGRVNFRRHFNLPTGVEPDDSLRLAFSDLPAAAIVRLNGDTLSALLKLAGQPSDDHPANASTARFEVSGLLQSRNQLEVELEFAEPGANGGAEAPGLWIDVWLEIEAAK